MRPGTPIIEALGIEPDTVLDIAVEANRPDALCMSGMASDLAARLDHLNFSIPEPPAPPMPMRRMRLPASKCRTPISVPVSRRES